MGLKAVYIDINEVPEQFRELYTEKNGQYELTGIEGVKTDEDVRRVQSALTKERNDHKQTKEKFSALGDLKPDDIIAKLDRIEELEQIAAGKVDDTKINELVETRLRSRVAPIEREKKMLETKVAELSGTLDQFVTRDRTRTIHDEVRRAAVAQKLLPEAIEDALVLAERIFEVDENGKVVSKDGVGVTPGVDPAVWFTELQPKRPHWWPGSAGGGAGGNRGGGGGSEKNPWAADSWNLTEQGRILTANRAKAEQLAKSAGTSIGGPRPAKK